MSEGLSTDSSWGPRIFPLSYTRDKTDKCLSAGNLFFAILRQEYVIYSDKVKLSQLLKEPHHNFCKTTKVIKFPICSSFWSSLFLTIIRAFLQFTDPLPLPTEDIMDLLNLCLASTYFQYNGKHYKQLNGTAMGSPVSVVVAEIVMQNIEESALSTCRQTIPLWLRYVDDTFTAVRHDEIDAFHHHLNEQNTDIQFTLRSKKMVNYLF